MQNHMWITGNFLVILEIYIAAITHEVTSSNLVKLISEALDHKSTRFPNLATGYFITSFLKISRGVRRAKISQGKNFS